MKADKAIKKPPLGIIPEWAWKEQRHKELNDAIHRYIDAGVGVPINWIAEHYALGMEIQMREEEKLNTYSKDNLMSGSNVATNTKKLSRCYDTDNDGNCPHCLNDPSLCPEKAPITPLFKDFNGDNIYEGNDYWVVLEPDWKWEIVKRFAVKNALHNDRPNLKYFSTEEKAIEFVALNKPVLSYQDILNWLDHIYIMPETWDKLKQLANSKIK